MRQNDVKMKKTGDEVSVFSDLPEPGNRTGKRVSI